MGDLKQKQRVSVSEIGLYLRVIVMDYGLMTNKQYAERIEEDFEVICTEEDVENYHRLHIVEQDYELESRRHEYGILY